MIKVIIADDHPAMCEGISTILNNSKDFELAGCVNNGEELLELLKSTKCDIVLTDIVMPELDGIKALKIIKKEHPEIKVVVLTMHSDRSFFDDAINSGADGYILKDDSKNIILMILKSVMEGNKAFTPRMQNLLLDKYQDKKNLLDELTSRELQVFKLSVQGYKNTEIAEQINVTPRTVLFHKQNIKDKLDAKSNAELVSIALKYKII